MLLSYVCPLHYLLSSKLIIFSQVGFERALCIHTVDIYEKWQDRGMYKVSGWNYATSVWDTLWTGTPTDIGYSRIFTPDLTVSTTYAALVIVDYLDMGHSGHMKHT
jgi:hypothetical protein